MATLGERVRERREEIGLSQSALAQLVGIKQQSIQAIESGKSRGTKYLVRLAHALRLRPEDLEAPSLTASQPARPDPDHQLPRPPLADVLPQAAPAAAWGGRDLPIYGKAQCGPEGYVTFPQGAIDWYPRPPELAGVRDAFAVFAEGDSMPRIAPAGSTVLVHPHRAYRKDDLVVVVKRDGSLALKLYVTRRRNKVVLWQENPSGEIEWPEDDVQAMYLVLGVMRR